MLRAATGQAEGVDTLRVTEQALQRAQQQFGDREPDAIVIFAAIQFEHEILLETLCRRFPKAAIIGCTAAADFSSNHGFSEDAVTLLLLGSDTLRFVAAGARELLGRGEQSVDEALADLDLSAAALCIFLTAGNARATGAAHVRLAQRLGGGAPIFGGDASRDGTRRDRRPRLFYQREIHEDAAAMLFVCGDDVPFASCVTRSWKPISELRPIGRVQGDTVFTIGEHSALGFYRHYLGSDPRAEFPLAVFDEGPDGDYFLRGPLDFDETAGSVRFTGVITPGSLVSISETSSDALLDAVHQTTRDALARFPVDAGEPAVAFAFSCNARKSLLGTRTAEELRILREELPDQTPILGFYGWGEFGPIGKKQRLERRHSASIVTLLLGARDAPKAPTHSAESTVDATKTDEMELLRRRLRRAEYARADIEQTLDANRVLLKRINAEITTARAALAREQARSEALLLNILPASIAARLKEPAATLIADGFESVTVLFSDLVGFTEISSRVTPSALVTLLNGFFSRLDELAVRHGLEKIKTIGDAYMVAGGVPDPCDDHAERCAHMALDMLDVVAAFNVETGSTLALRIGLHTGPVVAGVIGKTKMAYDLWGDTVNVAARMESHGVPGRIHISETTRAALGDDFQCESRGEVEIKGKGAMQTWFLNETGQRRPQPLV